MDGVAAASGSVIARRSDSSRRTTFGALCVGGVLISAAKLAHSHQQGYGGASQHTTSLVWTLVACVIAGSSAAIVGALS